MERKFGIRRDAIYRVCTGVRSYDFLNERMGASDFDKINNFLVFGFVEFLRNKLFIW